MTIVTLPAVYLNLATNTSVSQAFQNTVGLRLTTELQGEVRRMANGRLRAVSRSGKARAYELQLELCSRTQITWLETHVGQLVCVRDDRGRKIYCTYFAVPVTENINRYEYGDVTLSLSETTFSEAQ